MTRNSPLIPSKPPGMTPLLNRLRGTSTAVGYNVDRVLSVEVDDLLTRSAAAKYSDLGAMEVVLLEAFAAKLVLELNELDLLPLALIAKTLEAMSCLLAGDTEAAAGTNIEVVEAIVAAAYAQLAGVKGPAAADEDAATGGAA